MIFTEKTIPNLVHQSVLNYPNSVYCLKWYLCNEKKRTMTCQKIDTSALELPWHLQFSALTCSSSLIWDGALLIEISLLHKMSKQIQQLWYEIKILIMTRVLSMQSYRILTARNRKSVLRTRRRRCMLKSKIYIPFDECSASNFDCSERTA